MKKRVFALLLAAAMVLGLFACKQTPPETQPTETTAPTTQPTTAPTQPTPPDPMEVYTEASAALDALADISMDVTQVMTTTVEGQSFVDEAALVMTYSGRDTGKPVIRLEREVDVHALNGIVETADEDDEDTSRNYIETYSDGTLYVELSGEAAFSGSISPEDSEKRYIPALLLDAALYEELALDENGGQRVITFSTPTAAESWAMPEAAELLDAAGSAVIGADGTLQQMHYAITYRYGSAEISLTVDSELRAEADSAVIPEDSADYIPVQNPEALSMVLHGAGMLENAREVSISRSETIATEAGRADYEAHTCLDLFEDENGLITKTETRTYITDSRNNTTVTTQEENYADNTSVIIVDKGVPTYQTRVKEESIRDFCAGYLSEIVVAPDYWQDVTVQDLGSVYLLEYSYTEYFAATQQNLACTIFWLDPTLLNSVASDYVTNEITGYLAIDKYTGLLTASGIQYEGVHTIDGDAYTLSRQMDQMVEQPAFGAYKEITGQLREETAPEQPATPLFYHVTGAEGQEMWLLGTIHVGDVRTGFLPQEIYDALAESDALALEVNNEAFQAQLEENSNLAGKVSRAMYYSGSDSLEDELDPELYARLVMYMKASGNYNTDALRARSYLWQSSISDFYLQQGHQLHTELGVEERLIQLAKEQEKPIREIESGLAHIQMLTGWSWDLQLMLLEEVLSYSAEAYWTECWELYELWCAGDEEALRQKLFSGPDLSELTEEELAKYNAQQPLRDEYDQGMSHNRNAGMLETAIEYLESEEVIFYAVGLAHLLENTSGLVNTLRDAGYTVELVAYQQ